MVSAVKWEQTGTLVTLEGNGAALNNNTIAEANDAVYNGDTVLATHGWLEFTGNWSVAPSDDAPSIVVYAAEKADGTNHEDAPVTSGTDTEHQFRVNIPVRKIATAQRKVVGPILLPPHDVKFYIDNQTGQQLPAAWTLKLFYASLEGQ